MNNIRVCLENAHLHKKKIHIPKEKCDSIKDLEGMIFYNEETFWFRMVQCNGTSADYVMKISGDLSIDNVRVDILYDKMHKRYIMVVQDSNKALSILGWMLMNNANMYQAVEVLEFLKTHGKDAKKIVTFMMLYEKDIKSDAVVELVKYLHV